MRLLPPSRTLLLGLACTLVAGGLVDGALDSRSVLHAQAPAAPATAVSDAAGETENNGQETEAERNARFAKYMSGAKFIGRFTILGQADGKMPEEEYTIRKCEKLPEGDLFRFTARIRYGDTDTELPLDLPVQWAGKTPVITLEDMWLPGLGTFSTRVVIHHGRYAGTWDHGAKGGHLFGRIVPATEVTESPAATDK